MKFKKGHSPYKHELSRGGDRYDIANINHAGFNDRLNNIEQLLVDEANYRHNTPWFIREINALKSWFKKEKNND